MVVFSQHKGNIVNIFVAQKISFFKKAAEGKPWPLPFNHLAHGCPVSRRSSQEICHIFAYFGRDFRPCYQNIVMRLSFNAKQIKMRRQREFSMRFPLNFPFFSASCILRSAYARVLWKTIRLRQLICADGVVYVENSTRLPLLRFSFSAGFRIQILSRYFIRTSHTFQLLSVHSKRFIDS